MFADYVIFSSVLSHQPAAGVAYTHPTTVASYTVHQAPVAAHTVAAAYAPTAATVAVARPAPVAVAAAATAAAYGGYQPAHATTDYGYPQRQPEVAPPPPPVTSQNYQVQRLLCLWQHLSETYGFLNLREMRPELGCFCPGFVLLRAVHSFGCGV